MAYQTIHKPRGAPRERLLLIGGFQQGLYDALKRTNLHVEEVLSGREALESAPRHTFGVVLCSLRMQDAWGLDILDAILKADSDTPVIISTHEQHPKVVVEAMQRGAYDYIIEPFPAFEPVLALIDRAVRRRAALRDGRALRERLDGGEVRFADALVGQSQPFRELCERIRQVAPLNTPVLIEGESGAGKEGVARAIHDAGARRDGPYVAVHCGAIPESLLESELFGHEKGAFTGADSTRVGVFEAAHGGTLFLDEISLTSAACQAKLLRVLESGVVRRVGASREFKVDVRVISAANESLQARIDAKTFRQDLYYRLNVVTLPVPGLRDRREDIPLLAYHFAQRFAKEAGKVFEAFSQAAMRALEAYDYPGNVRELRNIVERAVVFANGPVIRSEELPEGVTRGMPLDPGAPVDAGVQPSVVSSARHAPLLSLPHNRWSLDDRLVTVERALIEQALAHTGGNRSRAASLLGINRTTLLQKLARLEVSDPGKITSSKFMENKKSVTTRPGKKINSDGKGGSKRRMKSTRRGARPATEQSKTSSKKTSKKATKKATKKAAPKPRKKGKD